MQSKNSLTEKLFSLLSIIFFIALFSPNTNGQDMMDVVYLKNGGVIHGMIIEQIPNQSIKIRTGDGNIFVYSFNDIEKITKEESTQKYIEKKKESPSRPLSGTSLLIQPLGFLQFGPVIEAEFRVGQSSVLGPRIRFHGAGVLSHVAADYDELNVSSLAVGIHFKQFLGNEVDRFYIGAVLEYGMGGGIDEEEIYTYGGYVDAEYDLAFIMFAANFGYRWRFDSGLFLGVGLIAGAALETVDEMTSPESIQYDNDVFLFGMVELTFGIEL